MNSVTTTQNTANTISYQPLSSTDFAVDHATIHSDNMESPIDPEQKNTSDNLSALPKAILRNAMSVYLLVFLYFFFC